MRRRSLKVAERGARLLPWLARTAGVEEELAGRWITHGAVYVAGRRCADPALALAEGAVVTVVEEEGGRATAETSAAPAAVTAIFEDEDLLAVAKPAGLNAQPTPGRKGESLLDQVSARLGYEAGLVHRLDRETSGVTVFGKTREATSALAAQFREGTARKRYLAACGPALPEQGTIDLPVSPDPSRPGRQRATRAANGAPAVTDFTRLFAAPDHALVALFPRTGRTHQLRAHLAALGAPILGDARYGGARDLGGTPIDRCLLHAQALQLMHPTRDVPLLLEARVPDDLRRLFERAGVAPPSGAW